MDGKQVLRHLRLNSEIPAVVISARHSLQDRGECALVGATGFLSKPFSTPDLVSFLQDGLAKARSAKAN
jgi:two-component system KDP operon response regulator KdpE